MATWRSISGDKEMLGKCEQFFLELMKVPRVESKLRVFSFKITFSTQVKELRSSLEIINDASREVRESVKLRRIMQTILSLGNALNQGTARGSAIGFKLDSLLKLTDTRARNNKMTLMHYLCKEHSPENERNMKWMPCHQLRPTMLLLCNQMTRRQGGNASPNNYGLIKRPTEEQSNMLDVCRTFSTALQQFSSKYSLFSLLVFAARYQCMHYI
eukprot:Gb_27500 [translate_table: standard]